MELQPTTKKVEAGPEPASLPYAPSSATTLILLGGGFVGTMFVGLTELFLSSPANKEVKRFALLIGPGFSQLLTAGALYLYKRHARQKFREFVEDKMMAIDLKIHRLPKKKTVESHKKLEELEEKRKYWEELLDSNRRACIDAD